MTRRRIRRPRYALARATLAALFAVPVLGVVLGVALLAGGSAPGAGPDPLESSLRDLEGIPQHGSTLGRPDAPATLTVYGLPSDLGAGFDLDLLPALIERYVRPGRLKIRLVTVTHAPGAMNSSTARVQAGVAHAATRQGRLWQFLRVFGSRYVGLVDHSEMGAMLEAVPGLDARSALEQSRGRLVRRSVARDDRIAARAGLPQLPGYVLERGGDRLSLHDPAAVIAASGRLLGAGRSRPAPARDYTPLQPEFPAAAL